MKRLTQEEFIKKAKSIHNDKYDYSKVDYKGIGKNIIVICKNHGEFFKQPNNHLNGQGCTFCSGKKKPTNEEFIKKAEKIHNNIYDYSIIDYKNKDTKIIIICKKHNEKFNQTPHNHLAGQGCPKCASIKYATNEIIDTFLLNKKIKRISVYVDANTKIKFKCEICNNIWETIFNIIKKGCGCPNCAGNKKLTTESFIKRANITHNNKYDYSLVNYIDAHTKVKIKCIIHNYIFEQRSGAHLLGQGCIKCQAENHSKFLTKKQDKFIEQANIIHNNKYDYSKVNYLNSNIEIIIICKCGEFKQLPRAHLRGSGCNICAPKKSKNEIIAYNFLKNFNINFNHQYSIKLPHNKKGYFSYVDFYIPDYNIFIEINGQQHYMATKYFDKNLTDDQAEEIFRKQKIRDNNLITYCNKNNIYLLEIDIRKYYDKKLENFLKVIFNGFNLINNFLNYSDI